jgi:hypothetical protein
MTSFRAASRLLRGRAEGTAPVQRQRHAARSLAYAWEERDLPQLVRLLHPEAVLLVENGVRMRDPIAGRPLISGLLVSILDLHPTVVPIESAVDGEPGIALVTSEDTIGSATIALHSERIARIRLVLDHERLRSAARGRRTSR